MIHYSLLCASDHEFDGWFKSSEAYEAQRSRGLVTCPVCNGSEVRKALMAPAVAPSDKIAVAAGHPDPAQIRAMLRAVREKVISEADYVGDRFAEEARKIHFEELPARGIYGEATREDVASLVEDGVDILPLPNLPEEHN